MREIKFRAWDKDKRKMVDWEYLVGYCDIDYLFGNHEHVPDFNVMQYTGLKDKNGKEIYEGDILRRNNNNKDLVQVKFGEFPVYELETEEVIDKACGWYLEVVITDELSKLAPFCYPTPLNKYWVCKLEIEVIGNYYEDKHLLGTENE